MLKLYNCYSRDSKWTKYVHEMKLCINIVATAFLAVAVVQGCSNEGTSYVVSDAEKTDTLSLREIHLSKELLAPTRMTVCDGRVVIYQCMGDTTFMVIPKPFSGKCYAAGIKGRGPNEFLRVDVQSIAPCGDGFICLDAGGRAKRVSIGDSSIVVSDVSTFNTEGCPQNGIITRDGYISANLMNDGSEFVIYKGDGQPVSAVQYPEWASVDKLRLPFAYIKNMIAHPSGHLFAVFYVYFRKFRIYDTDCHLVRDVDVRVPDSFPLYSPDSSDPSIAYSYPSATDENIYSLCHNRKKVSERGIVFPEIHVFGWYGRFKRRILLDRYIDIFTVDEKNGIVYGFNADDSATLYYAPLEP